MGVRAVFLVGFMASGKSSVGKALARRLRWEFTDLDDRIASRENKSVPEIFRSGGEAVFRAAESAALENLLLSLNQNTVVALGGGAFIQEQNRRLLLQWTTVFLDAPAAELWRRCSADPGERPLRTTRDQFMELYEQRLPDYRRADLTVDTFQKTPMAVAAEIESRLPRPRPSNSIDPQALSNRSNTGEPR
jgi:shikimate kinase